MIGPSRVSAPIAQYLLKRKTVGRKAVRKTIFRKSAVRETIKQKEANALQLLLSCHSCVVGEPSSTNCKHRRGHRPSSHGWQMIHKRKKTHWSEKIPISMPLFPQKIPQRDQWQQTQPTTGRILSKHGQLLQVITRAHPNYALHCFASVSVLIWSPAQEITPCR